MKTLARSFLQYKTILILIPLVSAAMHYKIFTLDLIGVHVWRQSQTQLNIQNFYRHDNNILNPRINTLNFETNIQRMEFPIMQWLIAQVHRLMGESIVITRVCLFVLGLFTVLGVFQLINALFKDTLLAALAAWSFNFGGIFYYYNINPFPDNFALCAGVWSLVFFERFRENKAGQYAFYSALFLCLAALAKLPYIIYGAVFGIYILCSFFKGKKPVVKALQLSGIYILMILPAVAWYVWVIPTWSGNGVIKGIFDNVIDFKKAQTILDYNFKEVLPVLVNEGNLIFFWLGLIAFFFLKSYKKQRNIELMAGGLAVIAYFLYELNMIDIVHSYYMMPFLPYLFMVLANGLKVPLGERVLKPIVIAYLLVFIPFKAFNAVNGYWSVGMTDNNNAKYLYREELRRAIPIDSPCILLNDYSLCVFTYMVDKHAFVFWNDHLPIEWIQDMNIRRGVQYMYSDSRKVDESPGFQPLIDTLIMQRGNIKVFKLKDLKK